MLQLSNIGNAVALKLKDVKAVLRLHLGQALQRSDAVARENEHLQQVRDFRF